MNDIDETIASVAGVDDCWYDMSRFCSIKYDIEVRDEIPDKYLRKKPHLCNPDEPLMDVPVVYCVELECKNKVSDPPSNIDRKLIRMLPDFEQIYYIGYTQSGFAKRMFEHTQGGSMMSKMLPAIRGRIVDSVEYDDLDNRDLSWFIFRVAIGTREVKEEYLSNHDIDDISKTGSDHSRAIHKYNIMGEKIDKVEDKIAKELDKKTPDNICIYSDGVYTGSGDTYL